jgi:F-box-like
MIPSPRLPTELCEMVFAYLDEPTLRTCSLTCKAFLPASQFRLFHTVCLKGRKVKRFFEITNSSPKLGLCVRILHIFEGRGRYRFEPRWLSSKLPLIASRLPEVTTLKLDSMEWSLLDGDARTALMSGFQKVKCLETIFSYFDDPSQMNQFIASFPSLIDLSCTQTYWKTDQAPMPSCVPLPLGLTTITLDSFQATFFDQQMNLEPHPDVRKLKFHSMGHSDAVGKLLKTIGSNLEHVYFHDFSSALGYMYNDADCEHSLIDIAGSF